MPAEQCRIGHVGQAVPLRLRAREAQRAAREQTEHAGEGAETDAAIGKPQPRAGEVEGRPLQAGGEAGAGGLITFTTDATPEVRQLYRKVGA